MADVVNVAFRMAPRSYYFAPGELDLRLGSLVVAETTRGIEIGSITQTRHEAPDAEIPQPLKPLLRLATAEDVAKDRGNRESEAEARETCVRMIREYNLPMRLVSVSYTLDRARLVFYFSADGRVDFRDLVRDLARAFRTRIELYQVGVRDQARMAGGFGSCGRPLCCVTFLDDFEPVAIKMAKEQGMSLNPAKISGMCGRLMCCLRYEYDTYRELRKSMPRVGSVVETPRGPGVVVHQEVLRREVAVNLADDEVRWFDVSELTSPRPPRRRFRKRGRHRSATGPD